MTRKRRRESSFEDYESYEEEGERDFDDADSHTSDGSQVEDSDEEVGSDSDEEEDGSVDASLASDSDEAERWAASDGSESDEGQEDEDAMLQDSDQDQLDEADNASIAASEESESDALPEPNSTSSSRLERLPTYIRRHIFSYIRRDPLATISLALSSKFFYKSLFRSDTAWGKLCKSFGRLKRSPNTKTWRMSYWKMMHTKCLWCGDKTTAKIGVIIQSAPNWLVMCVVCQDRPGPYQVIGYKEAIVKGIPKPHLRKLPHKLSRVPKYQRKAMRKYLYKKRFQKQYLRTDALAIDTGQTSSRWEEYYTGRHKFGLDRVVYRAMYGQTHHRPPDLLSRAVAYTLKLPNPQPHDFAIISAYYDALQDALKAVSLGLAVRRGRRSKNLKIGLTTRPKHGHEIGSSRAWGELIVDPETDITVESCIACITETCAHSVGKRKKRKLVQNRPERPHRAAAFKARQTAETDSRRCIFDGCTQMKKQACINERCGTHCVGCPAHVTAYWANLPHAVRRAVKVEKDEPDEG